MANVAMPAGTPEDTPGDHAREATTHDSTAPAMSPADEAAHRAASYVRPTPSTPRTLTTYERRDVRTTMSAVRGW